MSRTFAIGTKALGSCDRCGFTCLLKELRTQIVNRMNTGWKVCPECLDQDHPQWRLSEVDATDPQSLEDPRPDSGRDESRELTGDQFPANLFD